MARSRPIETRLDRFRCPHRAAFTSYPLARLVQKREALETVITFTGAKLTDFRKAHPEYFRMTSILIPDVSRPGAFERQIVFEECDSQELLSNKAARIALITSIEFHDAFMRDGFAPWTMQIQPVHERVDKLLKIDHSTGRSKE
jgi:hypothetical protein